MSMLPPCSKLRTTCAPTRALNASAFSSNRCTFPIANIAWSANVVTKLICFPPSVVIVGEFRLADGQETRSASSPYNVSGHRSLGSWPETYNLLVGAAIVRKEHTDLRRLNQLDQNTQFSNELVSDL
jgi:hypothetical protein